MNKEQLKKLQNDLWAAADKLRANSNLKASEHSTPVLSLIFLKLEVTPDFRTPQRDNKQDGNIWMQATMR